MSDWTDEEFGIISGKLHKKERMPQRVQAGFKTLPTDNLPSSVDWRDDGAVTTARRQGSCGSCWAFTASAALEGYHKIANPEAKIMRLAPQQLVDCASSALWGNFGCDGGFLDYAFAYTAVKPLMQEADYPYQVIQQDVCNFDLSKAKV